MFIDLVDIKVKAGNGGNGAMSFRREMYVANGGPDGGDGGRGGNVYLIIDKDMNTLLEFKHKKEFKAEDGAKGDGGNRVGKSGEDLYLHVPEGTIVKIKSSGKIIADMSFDNNKFLIAKGGKGGRGNAKFASSTRQVPKFAEQGEDGENIELVLELKLIAEVGLLGYPSVGKSTLLSMVSSAKPKIAAYHFTTLEPNLGVVKASNGTTFVMADIPGIIEGAHEGVGLGLQFLRHIERTKLLLHLVDIASTEGRDPIQEDYYKINDELKLYSEKLYSKKQIIVANKIDAMSDDTKLNELKEICKKEGLELFEISAATGQGIKEMIDKVAEEVKKIPTETFVVEEDIYDIIEEDDNDYVEVIKEEEDVFNVVGKPIDRLMKKVNVFDVESRQYMQRVLRKLGAYKELRAKGIKEGDTVKICDYQFEYYE